MIPALKASSMSFQGTEILSPRAAYDNLINDNRNIQIQEAQKVSTLEHPTPPTGQGEKLDVVA